MLEIIAPQNIIAIDERSPRSFVRDTVRLPWRLRQRRIDTIINMEAFVRYSSVMSFVSGARRRVGFHRFNQEALHAGDLLTHKVWHNAHIHTAHTFLDLVHALGPAASGAAREAIAIERSPRGAEDHHRRRHRSGDVA